MEIEIKRQIIHAMGIFTIIPIYILGNFYASLLFLATSVFFLFFGEYRKNKAKYKILKSKKIDEFEEVVEDEFKSYERSRELPFQGVITFLLGAFVVTLLFQTSIAVASIALLAMADSLSTVVGRYFGRRKLPINKKKTWEGSITFFLAGFVTLLFFIDPLRAVIIALVATLVEMMPIAEDNVTVPLATALLLFFL